MKNSFRYLMLGAAAAMGLAMQADSACAESMYEAVQKAVTTHPSIEAAKAAQGATAETVREQRSAYFPELSASITGGRVYADNSTSRGLNVTRGVGYSYLGEGTATLSQRVLDWGETGNKVDAAQARAAAADSTVAGTEETVAIRAIQAYVALLRAGELRDKAKANLKAIREYQEKIAIQVNEGGADEAELNRANDFLLLAENASTGFEGEYQQALADYTEVVGAAPETALKRPLLPATFPNDLNDAIDVAFATHPHVLSAKEALIASDHDMRAETTSYLPKVKTELSYLKRDQKDVIGGEAVDARALMKMDWNYSIGGAQHARVDRAEYLRAQSKAQLQETYRRVERDVRVAWSALDVVRQQFKTQENRKQATAKVVETYKEQYEGGKRTVVDLMQAESQAFDASVAFANADYGVLNATYTLLAATGQLLPAIKPDAKPELVSAVEPEQKLEDVSPAAGDVADARAVPLRASGVSHIDIESAALSPSVPEQEPFVELPIESSSNGQ